MRSDDDRFQEEQRRARQQRDERVAARLREPADDGAVKVWTVYGEDPNPDLCGYHHQPMLGHFRGTREQVIAHALTLPKFYTWGGGGDIEKVRQGIAATDLTSGPKTQTPTEHTMTTPTPFTIPGPADVPDAPIPPADRLTPEERALILSRLSPPWTITDQSFGRHIGRFDNDRYEVVCDALESAGWVDAHEENYQMDGKSPLSVRKPH